MMAKTVLLTLGRLPAALTLARALAARGCRVVVADPFRWHVARPSRAVHRCVRVPPPNTEPDAYRQAMVALVHEEQVDLVVPVSEEIPHVLALRDHLPENVVVLGPDLALCERLQDKAAFIEHAQDHGLSVPTSAHAGTVAAAALAGSVDTISKPIDGCSGLGLAFHRAGDTLPALPEGTLIQQRMEGEHLSSLTYLHGGKALGTAIYGGRVYSHTVSVCFESRAGHPAIEAWIARFVAPLTFTGFISFDFIVDSDGVPWCIECNPRPTSGLHFLDADLLGQALLDESVSPTLTVEAPARRQWAWSSLTEAWAALLSGHPREAGTILRELYSARDVVWASSDPLPFLLMTPMSAEILWPAMREGISMGEASQRDIAPLFMQRTSLESATDAEPIEQPVFSPDQTPCRERT